MNAAARSSRRSVVRARRAVLLAGVLLALGATAASAFFVKENPNASLDGKTVLSPAAERISTLKPDGGDLIGPGSTVKRTLLLQNRTDKPVEFDLAVSQVVGADAEDIVEVRHNVHEGAAAWVTLERNSVKLKSGATAGIQVTIAIPKAVKPGSKPFAVSATQRSAPTQTKGAGVTPIFRQIAIYVIDLPGDAPVNGNFTKGNLISSNDSQRSAEGKGDRWLPLYTSTGKDKDKLSAVVEYKNTGERLLNPTVRIEVSDIFGRSVKKYTSDQKFTVYPEGSNAATINLTKLPTWGVLRVKATVESDAGKDTKTIGTAIMLPWWVKWVALAGMLYLGYKVARWWIERRNLLYGDDIDYGEEDDLAHLDDHYDEVA
jgi:hypothetical protein